jgi:heat shock protein 4
MQMLEEDLEVPVSSVNEAPKDATKMDTDDAPSDPSGTDVNMQEEPKSADTTEGAAAENGAPDPAEKSVPMETDAKV